MATNMTYKGWVDASGNHVVMRKATGTETSVIFGQSGYGIDFKIWGAVATTDYLLWDNSASQLYLTAALTAWNSTLLSIYATPTATTVGTRNGTVNITTRRDIAWTNAWDGNADIGLKILSYNYSVSTSYGRIEAFEVLARNRTGSCSSVHGGYITAENYTGAGTVANLTGLEVHSKANAVISGSVKTLRVYDESQSSTGTTYGIELGCTGDSAFMREFGIFINATGSSGWTNAISFNDAITNVFDFENSDGTNGATLHEHGYTASGAGVKIAIDVAGTTYYLYAAATMTEV